MPGRGQRGNASSAASPRGTERGAPLLERGDVMRLSVLAAVVRDQANGRALVLDRTGNTSAQILSNHPDARRARMLARLQKKQKTRPSK